MKKNKSVTILTIIVVILVGVIIWQNGNSKPKDELAIKDTNTTIPTNNSVVKNTNEVVGSKDTTPTGKPIVKVTAPAKDVEALKSKFTYEVPVSKILDKKWQWVSAINYDESVFSPQKSSAFSLTFKKDGTFSGTTDCNSIFGKYTTKGGAITLTSIGQTLMFCDGSEEVKFTTYLNQVRGFMFNGDEELVLSFQFDSGSMIFK